MHSKGKAPTQLAFRRSRNKASFWFSDLELHYIHYIIRCDFSRLSFSFMSLVCHRRRQNLHNHSSNVPGASRDCNHRLFFFKESLIVSSLSRLYRWTAASWSPRCLSPLPGQSLQLPSKRNEAMMQPQARAVIYSLATPAVGQ